MLIGVLAVQGDFAAHAAALARLRCPHRLVRATADFDGLDALILPGGESSAMLKLLAPDGAWERLRDFARHQPCFGTCAGAILLAQRVAQPEQASLGALDLTAIRNAYGRQLESSVREAEVTPAHVSALGPRLETVLIRAPKFAHLGPAVEVLATNLGEPVLVRQGRILAAAFHPELSPASPVHRYFLERVCP